jgi:hypothetical protein
MLLLAPFWSIFTGPFMAILKAGPGARPGPVFSWSGGRGWCSRLCGLCGHGRVEMGLFNLT